VSEPIKSDWDLGRPDDHLRQCLAFATSKYIRLEAEVAALKAENERLRKTGDALARAAEQSAYHKEDYNVIKAWRAAKKVQP